MFDNAHSPRQLILITGVAGQVGRELVRSLAPLGEIVTTARTPQAAAGPHKCLPLDLADSDDMRRVVRDVRPTIIVNAAAHTAVDRAESESEVAMAINGVAPGVLAEEARRLDAALVHYSTDYVFDGSGTRPWREDDMPGPLSVYGRTKAAGEEAVRAAGGAHAILRIAWIYAAVGHNFAKTMLKLGTDRKELRVVADQFGAPTPAALVADATARILTEVSVAPAAQLRERGGTLHVPCGGETSWHGFAEEIFRLARQAGRPLQVERVTPIVTADYPTPARRPLNSRLDGTLVAEHFGVRFPDWRAALAETIPAIVAVSG